MIRDTLFYYIQYSALYEFRAHVKIIAFQTITNHSFWTFHTGGKPLVYIINIKVHGCLEISGLFLVLNVISCSTLEINLVLPRTHVLFSIYFCNIVLET